MDMLPSQYIKVRYFWPKSAKKSFCLLRVSNFIKPGSLHGRLYAIGGDWVDSVEVYDPDNNTWTTLQHK